MRVNQAAARTQATCASWTRDRRAFLPQRRCRCQNRPETAAGTAREGQRWDVSGIVSGIASASDSGSIPSARALLYLPPRPLLPSSQPPFPLCRNQWVLPPSRHTASLLFHHLSLPSPPLSSSTISFILHPALLCCTRASSSCGTRNDRCCVCNALSLPSSRCTVVR